eukprot:3240898-Pyramimonas_sp.AAC.1
MSSIKAPKADAGPVASAIGDAAPADLCYTLGWLTVPPKVYAKLTTDKQRTMSALEGLGRRIVPLRMIRRAAGQAGSFGWAGVGE